MQNHTTTNRPHTRPTCTAGVTTLTVSMSYTPFSASLVTVSWIMVLLLGWKRLQKNTFKSKFASNAEVLELERIGVYHTIRTGHCKLTKLNHSLEEVQILFHVEYEGCHFHHDKMTSVLVKTPNWNRTIPWNTSSLHNSLHTRAHTHTHTNAWVSSCVTVRKMVSISCSFSRYGHKLTTPAMGLRTEEKRQTNTGFACCAFVYPCQSTCRWIIAAHIQGSCFCMYSWRCTKCGHRTSWHKKH